MGAVAQATPIADHKRTCQRLISAPDTVQRAVASVRPRVIESRPFGAPKGGVHSRLSLGGPDADCEARPGHACHRPRTLRVRRPVPKRRRSRVHTQDGAHPGAGNIAEARLDCVMNLSRRGFSSMGHVTGRPAVAAIAFTPVAVECCRPTCRHTAVGLVDNVMGLRLMIGAATVLLMGGAAVAQAPRQSSAAPDFAGISATDQRAMESTCRGQLLLSGPAANLRCLSDQIAALRRVGTAVPSLPLHQESAPLPQKSQGVFTLPNAAPLTSQEQLHQQGGVVDSSQASEMTPIADAVRLPVVPSDSAARITVPQAGTASQRTEALPRPGRLSPVAQQPLAHPPPLQSAQPVAVRVAQPDNGRDLSWILWGVFGLFALLSLSGIVRP